MPGTAGSIMTVTGPVAPQDVGFTLPHEHVYLDLWSTDGATHVGQLADDDLLAAELGAFVDVGGSCLVDQTPGGAGRRPRALAAMSQRTGLKVVLGCGWYTEPFYPPRDDLARRSTADVAEGLIAEIREGLDGTGIRPGLIGEIGASQGWVTPLEERVHRAAARAQVATGLPLATHTLHHDAGREQMRIFDEEGVDPARVSIGHCDTWPSLPYCLEVARWGGYVSIDNVGFQLGDHEARVRRLVLELVEAGFAGQVLLSQDVGQMTELASRGGRGYAYLARTFLPALVADGLDEDTVAVITVDNPRRWLTIAR
jgi:predicted metal-dependent phosphotriesterase family hydrolase